MNVRWIQFYAYIMQIFHSSPVMKLVTGVAFSLSKEGKNKKFTFYLHNLRIIYIVFINDLQLFLILKM